MDGQTDKLNKRTAQMEGRTDGQMDWVECTNGLDGLDGRTGLTGWIGLDRRTGWTDGGADRLDGRKDGLTGWMDWMDGRTKGPHKYFWCSRFCEFHNK